MMQQSSLIFESAQEPSIAAWKVPEPTDLPYLTGVIRLSLDTETSGKNPFKDKVVGISIAYRTEGLDIKRLYAPVGHSEGNMDPEVVRSWLIHVIAGKEIIFANAKFDIQILKNGFGLDLESLGVKPHDVAFPDALLDDNRIAGRSLEELGQRYVGRGKMQFDGDKNRMADYPSWMVGPYAEEDAALTLEVDEGMSPFIKRDGLEKVLALENSIIYAVCEIERNGCRIDIEKLERWRKEVRSEFEKVILGIHAKTGMMVQPGSGASMAKLFDCIGVSPPVRVEKKKKGQSKKDFEEQQALAQPDKKNQLVAYEVDELVALKNPIIDMVVKARRLESLLSKFLDKYHDGLDGDVLRAQFHQLKNDEGGTVRGRFSSSGGGDLSTGYGFNAQQVIKTSLQMETGLEKWIVRELFVPDEGCKYFSADASQIEYRLATHFANAEKIIAAYRDDPTADYHKLVMGYIQQYKSDFTNRTIAKNTNFGFVYGAAAETTARTAGISIKEAREILDICTKVFPEAPQLLARLADEAKSKGYVTTIYGRRARFGPRDRFYAAMNAVIQGSAADVFKVTLKAVYDERKTLGITKLRQVVHDEFDGDRMPGQEYEDRIKDFINQQRVPLRVPITWNITSGANWKECH